jgi:ParB-like chromosome segregation protein Spo0J
MSTTTTKNPAQPTIANLEADVTFQLTPGSIKSGMREVNGGDKIAPSRDLWQLDPFELQVVEGLNPRVHTPSYLEHLRSLKESMKSEGFYQDKPLAGYVVSVNGKNVTMIYDGGSRLLSARDAIREGAKFTRVPVSISQDGFTMEDMLVAMVRGNSGRPLSMFETGLICKRLKRFQWDDKQIADRLGVTKQTVSNLMSLMNSPFEIRDLVANEKISASTAIEMIAKHGEKALEKMLAADAAATRAGKTRITAKYVPGASFTKAIKKSAPSMFQAIETVKGDPAFASLSQETQDLLTTLVSELHSIRKGEATADEGTKTPAEASPASE